MRLVVRFGWRRRERERERSDYYHSSPSCEGRREVSGAFRPSYWSRDSIRTQWTSWILTRIRTDPSRRSRTHLRIINERDLVARDAAIITWILVWRATRGTASTGTACAANARTPCLDRERWRKRRVNKEHASRTRIRSSREDCPKRLVLSCSSRRRYTISTGTLWSSWSWKIACTQYRNVHFSIDYDLRLRPFRNQRFVYLSSSYFNFRSCEVFSSSFSILPCRYLTSERPHARI